MPTNTAILQHVPAPFTPGDPDALYQAFMVVYQKSADRLTDPSQFYADAWCAYLRERGSKTTDQRAKELRWMAHEWRRRTLRPMESVSEAWDNTIPAMAVPRPMREVAIVKPVTRAASRPKGDPAYLRVPGLWAQGMSTGEIADALGKSRATMSKAITRMVRAGKLAARV